jgi:glycosyltransferase involved in cell wall biosynthesis
MINRKIYFVRFRHGHHSPHSGYSRITEYGAKIFNGQTIPVNKPLPRWLIRERIYWRLGRGTPGYTREAMAAELKVAQHILGERDCIYHFLYGETNYHYAGLLNGLRGSRIVATFHHIPSSIQKVEQIDWHLRQLAALICVGTNQVNYFASFLDPKKLHFIPLGIDVEYYQPPGSLAEKDPDLCIIIGENHRDFLTLRGVIELVSYLRPQTKFVCVMHPKGIPKIGSHPNLEVRSSIPEEELLKLYQTASLMVMPLYDATANNAVLESMACGLPMVISDVGAVRDYVNLESAAILPAFDARIMAEKVMELLGNPSQRYELGQQARLQALKFAWPKVIEQLKCVYDALD